MWNEIFDGISEKSLPTKAAPFASLHFSIIHWSLSKNMIQEQNSMFLIESFAKQQVWIDDLSEEKGRLLRFE